MVKKILTLCFVVLIVNIGLAQEETLISGEIESGGFGGPVIKFSHIKDKLSILVGGRGGWIINHTFVLGGGGYGLTNKIESKTIGSDTTLYLGMGYGGCEIGYIHSSHKLVHIAIQILIGAGGVSHTNQDDFIDLDWDRESDDFFILEPSVDLVLNVTDFFRFAVGASYRCISGVDLEGVTNSDLSGISAQISLKFGSF